MSPPSAPASQLDRLNGLIGMDTVELGVIPFTASVKVAPAKGFCALDGRLIVAAGWHARLWLDNAQNINKMPGGQEGTQGVRNWGAPA